MLKDSKTDSTASAFTVECGECRSPMALARGRFGLFYNCRNNDCDGTHGAHPDGRPLGVPANKATKKARIALHEKFDALWKSGAMTRKQAYRILREKLAISVNECHIGNFDISMCERALTALEKGEVEHGSEPETSAKL